MGSRTDFLLRAEKIVSGYQGREVLHEVTIKVGTGEIVALLGHNGAGKSTLLKAIFGIRGIWSGEVFLDEARLSTVSPRLLLRRGVAYVPQGAGVFSELTVCENLEIGSAFQPDARARDGIERVLQVFPALESRLRDRARALSGGQKRMLALASALITGPRLILLDEPSLGLSPRLVTQVFSYIRAIRETAGVSILIVEQRVREALKLAQRVYILADGRIRYSGEARHLQNVEQLRELFF